MVELVVGPFIHRMAVAAVAGPVSIWRDMAAQAVRPIRVIEDRLPGAGLVAAITTGGVMRLLGVATGAVVVTGVIKDDHIPVIIIMAVAAQTCIMAVIGMTTIAIGVARVIKVHLPPDIIRIMAVLTGAVVMVLRLVMTSETGVICGRPMVVIGDPPGLSIVTGRTGYALKVPP